MKPKNTNTTLGSILRIGGRFLVIAGLVSMLTPYAEASGGCGDWYNACNEYCQSQWDPCMAEYNDSGVCMSHLQACSQMCQGGFYDCIGNQQNLFCAFVGFGSTGTWVCTGW